MRSLFRKPATVPEITADELASRISAGERVQVIDVRERSEWNDGHIPNSTLIPLGDFAARINQIKRDQPVVMVCRSGNRSYYAAAALHSAGYTDVWNLTGGVIAWNRARHPLER